MQRVEIIVFHLGTESFVSNKNLARYFGGNRTWNILNTMRKDAEEVAVMINPNFNTTLSQHFNTTLFQHFPIYQNYPKKIIQLAENINWNW